MLRGSYYTEILLKEMQGKPYNRKWVWFKNCILEPAVIMAMIAAVLTHSK